MTTFTFHVFAYQTEGLNHKRLWEEHIELEVANKETCVEGCLKYLQQTRKIHPEVVANLYRYENPIGSIYPKYEQILLTLQDYSLYISYKENTEQ